MTSHLIQTLLLRVEEACRDVQQKHECLCESELANKGLERKLEEAIERERTLSKTIHDLRHKFVQLSKAASSATYVVRCTSAASKKRRQAYERPVRLCLFLPECKHYDMLSRMIQMPSDAMLDACTNAGWIKGSNATALPCRTSAAEKTNTCSPLRMWSSAMQGTPRNR